MSDGYCMCGGSVREPNPDCERCQLLAERDQLAAIVAELRGFVCEECAEGVERDAHGYHHYLMYYREWREKCPAWTDVEEDEAAAGEEGAEK